MSWVNASRGDYSGATGDVFSDSSGLFGLYLFASFPVAGHEPTFFPDYSGVSISAVRFTEAFSVFEFPNLSARLSSVSLQVVSSVLPKNFVLTDWPKQGSVNPVQYQTLPNSQGVAQAQAYQYTVTLSQSVTLPAAVQDQALWSTDSFAPQAVFEFSRRAEYDGFLGPLGGEAFYYVGLEFNIDSVIPPLRMQQRNDGLSIRGHARLNQQNSSGSSSVNTGIRLKEKNTYV